MHEINESDWKIFRQLHPVALERFCQRLLDENEQLNGDTTRSAHERYLAIYRLFREGDKEVARLFDGMSRSNTLWRLAAMKQQGLLTDDEYARFSQEMQNRVTALLEVVKA